MDKSILIGIVIRGLAWALSAKLGVDAAQATTWATTLGEACSAIVITGLAIWHSYQGRTKLKAAAG